MSLNSTSFKAYLAGLLDGDGSIYVRAKPNSSYRYGYQIAPYVSFFQSGTCAEFPELCESIGYGQIRLRKDGIYEFSITKQNEIKNFLQEVSPHLKLKQQQAKLIIEVLEQKTKVQSDSDFATLLELIDSFRELSYSKKRKVRMMTP